MKNSKALLIVFSLMIGNRCLGQGNLGYSNKDYGQFVRLFHRVISYTGQANGIRKPTVCLVRIRVDSAKNILDMKLSDSADSLLKAEFNRHKSEIDTKTLVSYFKSVYGNNNSGTYIIPLSFAMFRDQIPNQSVSMMSLYSYSKFDGAFLTGTVIFLDPIYSESSIPVR